MSVCDAGIPSLHFFRFVVKVHGDFLFSPSFVHIMCRSRLRNRDVAWVCCIAEVLALCLFVRLSQ